MIVAAMAICATSVSATEPPPRIRKEYGEIPRGTQFRLLPGHQAVERADRAESPPPPTTLPAAPRPPAVDPDDDAISSELNAARQVSLQSQTQVVEQPSPTYYPPVAGGGNSSSAPPRPWNLTFLTAYEYDSNISSSPHVVGLGSEMLRDDSRWVTAAFGEYRLIQRPDWNLGVIGSVFDNFHFQYDNFNVEDYMGGAYTNKAIGCFIAGMRYEFHETRLGGDHLAADHRLVPNLTYAGYGWGHTTAYYEFDTASSNAPALIPAQIQSGSVNAVGATQAIYLFNGQGRLYFGYRFEDVNADGDDYDRQTNMATSRIEVPFWGWIGDVEARYFWDDYANPNSLDFFDRPRYDRRLELRAGLQRNFNQHWSLRLDYTHVDTDSNVENLFGVHFFQYDRNIFSSQIIYDF